MTCDSAFATFYFMRQVGADAFDVLGDPVEGQVHPLDLERPMERGRLLHVRPLAQSPH